MGRKCCVYNCGLRSEKASVKFFRFPMIETRRKKFTKLSEDRRLLWIKAINRKNLKLESLKYAYVCSKHFISGRSSKLTENLNVDWVPTQNLGYSPRVAEAGARANQARYNRSENRQKTKAIQSSLQRPGESKTVDNETLEEVEVVQIQNENVSCETDGK